MLLAATATDLSTTAVVTAFSHWTQTLQHLGPDRNDFDGRQNVEQLAVLCDYRYSQAIAQDLYGNGMYRTGVDAFLDLDHEIRQNLFESVAPKVSPDFYYDIQIEQQLVAQSIGVTRPLRLALLGSSLDDYQDRLDWLYYRPQSPERTWSRALSLTPHIELLETNPYQVIGPAAQATPSHPSQRLADHDHLNAIPLASTSLMHLGGLTVLGVASSELDALNENPDLSSFRLVDLLIVSGQLTAREIGALRALIRVTDPMFTLVAGDRSYQRTDITHDRPVFELGPLDREYSVLFFNPANQQMSVEIIDTHTGIHTAGRAEFTNTHKRIEAIFTGARNMFLQEHEPEALDVMMPHAINYLSRLAINPYLSYEILQKDLGEIESLVWSHVTRLGGLRDQANEVREYHEAFASLLFAWGLLPPTASH